MRHADENILTAILNTYMYCDIHDFPVNLQKVAHKLHYTIKTYSDFSCGEGYTYTSLMKISKDGITFRDGKERLILVNENKQRERIRFTVAHEIGHIVMPDANENEADTFASHFLAPAPIIYSRKIKTQKEIAEYFDISLKAAAMAVPSPDYMPYVNGMEKEIIRWFGDEWKCESLFLGDLEKQKLSKIDYTFGFRDINYTSNKHQIPEVHLKKLSAKEEEIWKKKKIRSLKGKITRLRAKMTLMTIGDEEEYEKAQNRLADLIHQLKFVTGDDEYTW